MTRDRAERLKAVLDRYLAADPIEAVDVARLRAAVEHGDVYGRTAPLHVTGSALVVHLPTGRVLLRWHPRMQMWMQVGGHFDAGEDDPFVVALREAREETGLTNLRALDATDPQPIQVVIVPVPARAEEPAHEHADFRYVLATDSPNAVVAESADAKLRWLELDAAITETTEPNLREFLTRTRSVVAYERDPAQDDPSL